MMAGAWPGIRIADGDLGEGVYFNPWWLFLLIGFVIAVVAYVSEYHDVIFRKRIERMERERQTAEDLRRLTELEAQIQELEGK